MDFFDRKVVIQLTEKDFIKDIPMKKKLKLIQMEIKERFLNHSFTANELNDMGCMKIKDKQSFIIYYQFQNQQLVVKGDFKVKEDKKLLVTAIEMESTTQQSVKVEKPADKETEAHKEESGNAATPQQKTLQEEHEDRQENGSPASIQQEQSPAPVTKRKEPAKSEAGRIGLDVFMLMITYKDELRKSKPLNILSENEFEKGQAEYPLIYQAQGLYECILFENDIPESFEQEFSARLFASLNTHNDNVLSKIKALDKQSDAESRMTSLIQEQLEKAKEKEDLKPMFRPFQTINWIQKLLLEEKQQNEATSTPRAEARSF